MRGSGFRTRARAWYLRTFKGRSREDAGWTDEPVAVTSPPQTFQLGELTITATPVGLKAAGTNQPSAVWEVTVGIEGDSRSWGSKYGLPPADNSARAAVELALDELDQIWRDPDGWAAEMTAGMTEDEAEAMGDSPAMRLDLKAAQWIGPHLDAIRASAKGATGRWIAA